MLNIACKIIPSLTTDCLLHAALPLILPAPILASFSFLNRPYLLLLLLLCLYILYTQLALS